MLCWQAVNQRRKNNSSIVIDFQFGVGANPTMKTFEGYMAIDVLCLTEEQQQQLNDLLKACRFLVKLKEHKMTESATAVAYAIDQVEAVLRKIDKAA
jgi:Spy/CpxP family protein refolding chaperone